MLWRGESTSCPDAADKRKKDRVLRLRAKVIIAKLRSLLGLKVADRGPQKLRPLGCY
jgi:hypothetical protein